MSHTSSPEPSGGGSHLALTLTLNPTPTLTPTPNQVSHTSDHFAAILKLQTRMLEEGLAYVDPSPQEAQKKERMAKQASWG